ncbi:MAG: hypothetical protein ABSG48_01875 [Geobacteraceae bacterium]
MRIEDGIRYHVAEKHFHTVFVGINLHGVKIRLYLYTLLFSGRMQLGNAPFYYFRQIQGFRLEDFGCHLLDIFQLQHRLDYITELATACRDPFKQFKRLKGQNATMSFLNELNIRVNGSEGRFQFMSQAQQMFRLFLLGIL